MMLALSITLVVSLAIAFGVGEVVHHYRTPYADESHGGFRLDLLAGSALTLAVIMCSFTLAISYSRFNDAARDASNEAGAVSALYEAAGLLPDEADARLLQQDTICYARAVVDDE